MFLNTKMPLSKHPLVPAIGDYRPFSLKNPLHVVNGDGCLLSNEGGEGNSSASHKIILATLEG